MTALVFVDLLALVLLPGIGASLALYPPGRLSFTTRLALALGLGYAIVGGISFVLVLLSVLTPAPYFLVLGGVTVAVWVLGLRRGSLRDHARSIAAEVRGDRWPIITGVAVIAAIALVRTPFLGDFPTASPFRYWVDGMELADHGGIPSATLHYGGLWPPVTSKIILNTFTAAAHYATGGHMPQAFAGMLWITAVGTAIGLWATARELGLRWTAPLLPVLLIANQRFLGSEMTADLLSHRAETVGRMVAFSALPLAISALRERRSYRDGIVAGCVLAAAAGTHLIAYIAAVVMLLWYAVARLVIDRRFVAIIRHGAVMGGVAAILTGAVLLLPRGEIGFEGAAAPSRYERTEVSFDKSRFLFTGSTAPMSHPPRGRFYVPPGGVIHSFVSDAIQAPPGSLLYRPASTILLALAAALLAVAILLRFPTRLRPNGVVAVGLAGTMVGLALGFSFAYDVFIPATFGVRRLFDYASLTVVLLGLTIAEALLSGLQRIRPWAPAAAGIELVVLLSVLTIPTASENRAPARHAREVLQWVRSNTPCDARLLTNQRTLGAFRAMTGRVAVLEGMGPFLRPQMLDSVVDQLLRARAFYADPVANRDYLAEHGIDHVLFLKSYELGPAIGVSRADALREAPFLERVHSSKALDAYRVHGVAPRRSFPDPRDHPAFDCRTAEIP